MAPRKGKPAVAVSDVAESAEESEYPKAMYKKNAKDPNGWTPGRAENEKEATRLAKAGFKDADDFFKE